MEKLTEEQTSGWTAGRRVERQGTQLEICWRIQARGDPIHRERGGQGEGGGTVKNTGKVRLQVVDCTLR